MSDCVSVYSFADVSGDTIYVDSNDYNYTGTWSGTGTYSATTLDTVSYASALYICIIDNIGDNPRRTPTRTNPSKWSILSLLYEYQCPGTNAPDTVGEQAYLLAESGTNIAWAAYYLAQIGTNTGSAAYDLAGSAYTLAGSAATDAANALSTANGAFTIAVAGTNAAATAQSTADAAYALAQIGTNTGTAAFTLATAGSNLAWQAYLLASGTGSSNVDATARSVADFAYYLAQVGTNTGSTAYSVAQAAFSIAVIGTNAAATAQSTASAAYDLAQIGTNTGTAAYNLATSGSNVAWAAYQLAQIGTTIPNFSAGGTMTGNLKVPNIIVGTGTVPVSDGVNGTIYYDMAGPAYQLTTASSPFQVSLKNTSNGAEICAVLISDGTQRAITYDSGFSWFGTQVPYTSVVSGNKILVAMSCISATGTNILGATSAQI